MIDLSSDRAYELRIARSDTLVTGACLWQYHLLRHQRYS